MDEGDRRVLEQIARSRRASPRRAHRARALLLAAEGTSTIQIADQCGVIPATIRRWRAEFQQLGAASVSRTRQGKMPMTQDDFAPGHRTALCGLYLGASERAAVWSDEAMLPFEQRWLCVYEDPRARSHRDFLRFLRAVEVFTPVEAQVHVLMDNGTSHTRHDVDLWLSNPRRERFRLYVTRDPVTWVQWIRRSSRGLELEGGFGQWVYRPVRGSAPRQRRRDRH